MSSLLSRPPRSMILLVSHSSLFFFSFISCSWNCDFHFEVTRRVGSAHCRGRAIKDGKKSFIKVGQSEKLWLH